MSKWKMKQVSDNTEFNRQIILRRTIWSMILKILKIIESVTKYSLLFLDIQNLSVKLFFFFRVILADIYRC